MYIAYVEPQQGYDMFPDKAMLMFMHGETNKPWWYPGSDQYYRGIVYGWIGPLPSPKISDLQQSTRPEKKFAIGKYPEIMHGCFTNGPFDTIKQATEEWGNEDEYIARVTIDGEPKVIRKWSDHGKKWEKV